MFAPDGSTLLAPEAGGSSYVVEKAVAGDYPIHVIGGGATASRTHDQRSREAAPPPPAPPPANDRAPGWMPDPGEKVVYLTFDDGPDGRYTPKILEALRKYDARATFFVVGTNLENQSRDRRKDCGEGSTLANHTWNHGSLAGVSQAEFRSAVGRTQELMGSLGTRCLRPPYGSTDANTESYAREMGLTVWKWTIDTVDYRKPSPDVIAERAAAAGPGSIVLMHDGGGDRRAPWPRYPRSWSDSRPRGTASKRSAADP